MTNDVPLPVWSNATRGWEPVDMRDGQRVTWWPDGFDPGCLPQPEYREGDHVQFVRDETCAREGRVRRVLLTPHPGTCPAEEQQVWYLDASNILYIVTARGHDHRVRAADILGRFVSSERLSRIVPLQE